MTSGNIPGSWNVGLVTRWLAEKDQDAKRAAEASLSEQTEIARNASVAANRAAAAAERQASAAESANRRATVALILASISIVATIVGTLISHFDVHR